MASSESTCDSFTECQACAESPSCAWCASAGSCVSRPQAFDISAALNTSEHVVEIDNETYGCRAFIGSSSTCAKVESSCQADATCGECLERPGCGMCTPGRGSSEATQARCVPGSRHNQFAFEAGQDLCNGDTDTWSHASQPSGNQCEVDSCTDGYKYLAEKYGTVHLGNREQEVYYQGGLRCSWIIWPGGLEEGNITYSTWYLKAQFRVPDYNWWSVPMAQKDQLDYLAVFPWASNWPADPADLEKPQSWPRGTLQAITSPSTGGSQTFPPLDVDLRGPVIVDFVSYPPSPYKAGEPSLQASLEISWEFGRHIEEKGEFNLRTAGMILLATIVIVGTLSVALRIFRRRSEAQARQRSSCTRVSVTWTVEQILQQVPSMEARCMTEDSLDASERNNCCSVCLGDLGLGDNYRLLPCLHRFHVQCIDPWLPKNPVCPLCRQGLGLNEACKDLCLPAMDAASRDRDGEASPDFVPITPQDGHEVDGHDTRTGNHNSIAPQLPAAVIGAQTMVEP